MGVNTDQQGLLTTKPNETRITSFGRILRKFKIDEWPQFINVLIGSMSVVGPRPEVPYFVNLYTPDQLKVLQLKPGITDYASIKYFKENELLASSDAPEQTYIHVILPDKLNLNLEYLKNQSFLGDIEIIFQTFLKILR